MKKYRILYYNDTPKFISSMSMLTTIRVIKPLNIISLLKVVFLYLKSELYTVEQVLSIVGDNYSSMLNINFDIAVLGKENEYIKSTSIDYNTGIVTKNLLFNSNSNLYEFKSKIETCYRLLYEEIKNINNIRLEKLISIDVVGPKIIFKTEVLKNVRFNWFQSLYYYPIFLDRLKKSDSSVSLNDFKIHNTTISKGFIYIYDLETLDFKPWSSSVNYFIDNLFFYSKYGIFPYILYSRVRKIKGNEI